MVGKPYTFKKVDLVGLVSTRGSRRRSRAQAEGIQGFRLKAGGPNPSAFSLNPFSLSTCLGPISGESFGEAMGKSDHAG